MLAQARLTSRPVIMLMLTNTSTLAELLGVGGLLSHDSFANVCKQR